LGFTGEQSDAESGFTYLRARYLSPSLGRFLSADSVQPNAPGSQGYNHYSYVAMGIREYGTLPLGCGPPRVTAA
jgi:RHS repeat-associated protein